MHIVSQTITYILLFIALYFEIFLLITYFENSERRVRRKKAPAWDKLPSVSILVPVWNESKTLLATVDSILSLNYPADKLSIFVIDDGSTDDTRGIMKTLETNQRIKLLYKENGGKHTALNYALGFVTSNLVGCLDADSFVDKEALMRIVTEFAYDKELMAVTPSIKINNPKTVLELIQKVEYGWGVMLRHLMASLGAVYVTPGPFSIFKKEVFDKLGGYRRAHNTEDMEIAVRMQKAHMRIGNAFDAFILTNAPKTLRALVRQRLRWTYGFIMNAYDNRDIYFNPRYGNLGLIVLPTATLSIFSTIFLSASTIYGKLSSLLNKYNELSVVGWHPEWSFNFDLFYVDTTIVALVSTVALTGTLFMLFASRKMAEGSTKLGMDLVFFLTLYIFLAPIWMARAVYNAALHKDTSWR